MSESRKVFRYSTDRAARILLKGTGSIACAVRDISTRGARLETSEPMKLPVEFFLLIEGQSERLRCQVMWHKGTMLGVQYW